jgi:two-component system sensor histidine kinase UhpB
VHTIFYNNLPCRLVLANDITEKMKVEKRLEFLVSASPAVIYSAAAEFPFGATFISENIKEQTGHVPKEFTSNPNFWSDHIHPLDKERVLKDIGHLFKEGRYTHEYRFRLKDGSYTWMYDEVKLLYDSAGKPLEMIGYWIKINERKQAEEKINQTNEQLRQLTTHLQKIREEERKRIGREIHDDLGQQLTAIKMDVAWVDKKIPAETTLIKSKLKNIITLLDGSNQSIRRILTELRPGILDDYGLLEALDWHGRQFTANTGIQVTINTNESEIKLSEPIATCLFRVYQEALTNISKHAHADKAIVSINLNDETIFMHINDNGRGFDDHSQKKRTSFGILGMKERVHSVKGDFELSSKPGMGTKISITIPLT